VRKPQRKQRKSDGDDSGGKPQKKRSTGEKSGAVDDTERCTDPEESEQPPVKRSRKPRKKKADVDDAERCTDAETDVLGDSEQPVGNKTGKSRKKKSSNKKSGTADNTEGLTAAGSEVIGDSEPAPTKPPRRKRSKKSAAECRSESENFDVVSIPGEVDSAVANLRRSANRRLTDKLRSPLLQIIDAGDADDFADDGDECPMEQNPHESVSLGHETVAETVVETHFGVDSCGRMKQLFDDVFVSPPESSVAVHQTNDAASSSVCQRARVQTPPTSEETSAALRAMEEAGRLSPVNIMELVDLWKREKSEKSEFISHDAVTNGDDDELPAFGMALKPSRKVFNGGQLVNSESTNLDAGKFQSDEHSSDMCSIPVLKRSSPRVQKPSPKMAESTVSVDQSNDFSDCEGSEEELTMLAVFERDLDSRLPDAAADVNRMSVNILHNNPTETPSGEAGGGKTQDDENRNENLGFSRRGDISVVAPHTASEQRGFCDAVMDRKVPSHQILVEVDEFSPFDDTNDDQFLAAAVATPVAQYNYNKIPIIEKSSNVSGINLADNSQLTFTQALACLHDSLDVSRVSVESPGIYGRSGKAEYREENLTKVEKPHFDLGFELSDDDDGDGDDDDIIPPSPPLSSSLKSGTRLGSRANSLITISRQNSVSSPSVSGADNLVEDATDTDCTSMRKTELVGKQSSVGNVLLSDFSSSAGWRSSPTMVSKSLTSEAPTVAVEKKSRDYAPVSQSGTSTMEKKSRVSVPVSERNSGAMDQKSRDLLSPTVQSRMEEKSRDQAYALTVDQKSADPAHSGHVAVIHPCVRSLATPTAPANQSEMRSLATPTVPADQSELISPPSALSASTPLKPCLDEKCEFLLLLLFSRVLNVFIIFPFFVATVS